MGFFNRKKKEQRLCPNCRKPVADGTAFCDSCGLRVSPPPSCAKCHQPLAPDTNFCEACGTPVGTKPSEIPDSGKNPEDLTDSPKKTRSKNRKGRRKGKPKKDEFVHPSMIIPVQDPEEKSVTGPAPSTEDSEKKNDSPASPVTPRVPQASQKSPSRIPALRKKIPSLSKKNKIIAGLVIIALVIALAFLAGIIHITPPSFLKGISGKTAQAPAVVEPDGNTKSGPLPEQTLPSPSFVPGPTQVPPESYLIWLQAERDPITNMVTVIFNGGKGQRAVRDVQVRLTRSDGQVMTGTFKPLTVGEGASLQGTKYTDRLEVNVTYNNGNRYTVIDQLFVYKQRN